MVAILEGVVVNISDPINWDAWRFWVEGVGVLAAVGTSICGAAYTWWRTRKSESEGRLGGVRRDMERSLAKHDKGNEREHNRLGQRLSAIAELSAKTAGRVDVLEERMQGLPRHADLTRIWKKLDQHNALISRMLGQVEQQTGLLQEINHFLMNRSRGDG